MSTIQHAPADLRSTASRKLGIAWLGLCFALSVHAFEEATTGFLDVYNPTVIALRQRLGFWPMPTLELGDFLTIMTIVLVSMFVFDSLRISRIALDSAGRLGSGYAYADEWKVTPSPQFSGAP